MFAQRPVGPESRIIAGEEDGFGQRLPGGKQSFHRFIASFFGRRTFGDPVGERFDSVTAQRVLVTRPPVFPNADALRSGIVINPAVSLSDQVLDRIEGPFVIVQQNGARVQPGSVTVEKHQRHTVTG